MEFSSSISGAGRDSFPGADDCGCESGTRSIDDVAAAGGAVGRGGVCRSAG